MSHQHAINYYPAQTHVPVSGHVGDMSTRRNGRFKAAFGARYPESIQRKEIIDFLLAMEVVPKPVALLRNGTVQGVTTGQTQKVRAASRSMINDKQAVSIFSATCSSPRSARSTRRPASASGSCQRLTKRSRSCRSPKR
jgi:hypothetical protein